MAQQQAEIEAKQAELDAVKKAIEEHLVQATNGN